MEIAPQNYKMFNGFIDIKRHHLDSGLVSTHVSKPNTILKQGAKVISHALAGVPNYHVRYIYVGYCNNVTVVPPVIDTDYSVPFSALGAGFGYLREPISFSPSFRSDTDYVENMVFFTATVSSASTGSGAAFTSALSQIYEIGLVASPTGSVASDLVLARANFNPLTYDSNENLVITWGLKILV